ncbi:hypothetical protein ACN38_g12952, partial [Penicillium nordicum]
SLLLSSSSPSNRKQRILQCYFSNLNHVDSLLHIIRSYHAPMDANKGVAKNSDASLTSRASVAKDAVVDKKDEKSHDVKADVQKESAKN